MIKHISTGFNYENKLTFFLEVPFFPNLHSAISSGCLFFRVPFFPGAIFSGDIFPTPIADTHLIPASSSDRKSISAYITQLLTMYLQAKL